MSRRYEIVYILDSALDETQVNSTLEKHHALLKSADEPEPVKEVNHWGKRSLAYPINNAQVGYYAVVDFRADPSQLPEFERALKLDESIIRYLTVLNEGEVGRPMPHPSESDDRDDRGGRGREGGPGRPVAGKPAESKPAAEAPATEKPAETKPAAEAPASEKPAEEKPAAEAPAAEKPAADTDAEAKKADAEGTD